MRPREIFMHRSVIGWVIYGGRQFVAGYGFGSPGISTTDVVIGLFYICK